jgi:sirohydrochlorin cobaltochelatase
VLPLVGLAHGSRDPRVVPAIEELLAAVADRRPGLPTAAAYLDLTDPDLTAVLGQLGVPEVVVLPLLFTEAYHAQVDSPQALTAAAAATGVRIRRAGILGLGPEVLAALQVRAIEVGIGDDAGIVLAAVGSSSPTANIAVADLATRWTALRRGPVTAAFATTGEPSVGAALNTLAVRGPVGVVPLFVAPGLLLTAIEREAAAVGAPVAAPLGTELADLVLARYDQVAG